MTTVTIGFSKSKKKLAIGSYAIRTYYRTPYSHVYIKFKSKSLERVLIYEAVGGGLRFIGTKLWESHAQEVASFDIKISQASQIKLLQYCIDNAGVEYGTAQNIGIFICDILGTEKNPFKSGKNCSEVVGEILKLEGYVIDKDINLVTPKDIYKVLSENQTARS